MAVVTFGRGLSQPNAQTGAISSAEGATASASGLMGFIQLLTGALIAQSMPFVLEHGTVAVMSCMLVAPILAMTAHLLTLRRATPVANGQSPAQ
jgi:DHA1 family bicyclomycin/chloramphenicol resistance-like MFS transporter